MSSLGQLSCLLAVLVGASDVFGHGSPIGVSVQDGRLVASHETDPFAPLIFGQPDGFDDFADVDNFPGIGDVILWDIPGLDIQGMSDSASLSIEVLARPVIGSMSNEHRLLWYWNPTSGVVEQSPAEFHLFGTGARTLNLQPAQQQSLPPFTLAAEVAGETGFHNHTLVFFGLDDDATAPAGVYGFFARFLSNAYEPSDPFLLLFNYFAENDELPDAGLAIYEAATLPGDFDLDDDVDGRDFLAWQRLYGSTWRTVADASLNGIVDTADLAIWQQNFGDHVGMRPLVGSVPEPSSVVLLLAAIGSVVVPRRGWSG